MRGDEGYLAVMVLNSIQEDVGLAFEFHTLGVAVARRCARNGGCCVHSRSGLS